MQHSINFEASGICHKKDHPEMESSILTFQGTLTGRTFCLSDVSTTNSKVLEFSQITVGYVLLVLEMSTTEIIKFYCSYTGTRNT
ncbi:hypothetical protein RUM44_013983 [Polyplax serrata]|uniref:Uncharacterized protein n=1 Tax=Polyplax serrata TaxID=468196 RepID=A0ABR1BJX9_POLSC